MEFRVLQYFLAVTREQNISAAAEALHLSQPTLSRQLRDMEEALGKQLFLRGSRKITLTEEGLLLKKRAEEILDLVNKTQKEIASPDDVIAGDIMIGAGETKVLRLIAKAAHEVQAKHPHIHYHISSGDGADVEERLDRGLIDFGVLVNPADLSKYDYLTFPEKDVWGVLMRKDSPLAARKHICAEDLWDKPLIVSRQAIKGTALPVWLKRDAQALHIAATYSLLFNGSLLVEQGLGYALCLKGIINTTGDSVLCFRPLAPALISDIYIVWKKYPVFSKAASKFLETLRKLF